MLLYFSFHRSQSWYVFITYTFKNFTETENQQVYMQYMVNNLNTNNNQSDDKNTGSIQVYFV